jgi:hypothetical protein
MKNVSFAVVPSLALIFSLNYEKRKGDIPKWIYAFLLIEPVFYLANL